MCTATGSTALTEVSERLTWSLRHIASVCLFVMVSQVDGMELSCVCFFVINGLTSIRKQVTITSHQKTV